MAYSLRLIEDRLAPGASHDGAVPALNRIVYVTAGELVLDADGGSVCLARDRALHRSGPWMARAGVEGAHVLRFELCRQPPPSTGGGCVILEHPIALAPGSGWLMRCDRVDFEPDGVALPHRHRGGGIRRLLRGRLEVTVGGGAPRLMRPGDAWFESGREPVLAVAAKDTETGFIRISVLPAEIRGRSSIVYVDPADAARSRPRTYTVHVDAPITLSRAPGDALTRSARAPTF